MLAFAGWTLYAYPFILHVMAVVRQHPKLLNRALDVEDLKGHLIRVLNHVLTQLRNQPDKDPPSVQLLLAGWSWKRNRFIAWVIHYDNEIRRFTHRRVHGWSGENREEYFAFIGDYFTEFKTSLIQRLREKGSISSGAFDMEPFEVLRDMLRSGKYRSIGGAPQMAKIYRHANVVPHAVKWPTAEAGSVALLGRPLLPYEKSSYLVIDPDSLEVEKHE